MLCSRSKSKHIRILGRFITSAALNPSRNALLTPCTHRLLSSVNYKILSKKCYLSSEVSKNFVRSMSNESSQKKKESSVFNELMEAKEQPQSQLTVGAKGEINVKYRCCKRDERQKGNCRTQNTWLLFTNEMTMIIHADLADNATGDDDDDNANDDNNYAE